MRTSLTRRLFRRRKPQPLVPILWREQRIHEMIAADVAADPEMCEPLLGEPKVPITRLIDQGETAVIWDWESTRTMETRIVEV